MLRIPNVFDLDKTDYQALEGENRDLYGWIAEGALSAREVPESGSGRP